MASGESPNIALVREYFRRVDAESADLLDLFVEDFEFYFPKYGFGRGAADFIAFAIPFRAAVAAQHDRDNLRFIDAGDTIICEGTTFGHGEDGVRWEGGKTAAGRFCSVYEVVGGRIASMRIYVDPDYTSQDMPRFRWGVDRNW